MRLDAGGKRHDTWKNKLSAFGIQVAIGDQVRHCRADSDRLTSPADRTREAESI